MRRILPFILLCCFSISSSAQSLVGGSTASGMGHAGTALVGDFWGESNPALSASVEGRSIGLFASQAYGLGELQYSSLRYVEPTSIGSIALEAASFGFDAFRDTKIGLEFSRGFSLGSSRTFMLGLRLRYSQLSITDYGSASAIGISVGGLTSLLPTLHLGFSATNLNQPEIAGSNLDRNLAAGIMYEASDRMRFSADIVKEVRYPVSFRGGIEIRPVDALSFRTGATTKPTRFTAGMAVHISKVEASFTAERHQNLGWSPAGGLSLRW